MRTLATLTLLVLIGAAAIGLHIARAHQRPLPGAVAGVRSSTTSVCCQVPVRVGFPVAILAAPISVDTAAASSGQSTGMVWLPGGEFTMGSDAEDAEPQERPAHHVKLGGFWIDPTDVTNDQFGRFVQATGYVTTAERKPDWEEMKRQLPPDTPKPGENVLVAGSLVFVAPDHPVPLDDVSAWWRWTPGADWRHPRGPGSSIAGMSDHPVVQVSWDDAAAYANWAGKRLPTEAQWEFAARGGLEGKRYAWGDEEPSDPRPRCNIWQGRFPDNNLAEDGYVGTSPVNAFPPNAYGLYDMAGNVWQWCADAYAVDAYRTDSAAPTEDLLPLLRVVRGGSFLCNATYCASYRVSARRGTSPDTSLSHTGFRCVLKQRTNE